MFSMRLKALKVVTQEYIYIYISIPTTEECYKLLPRFNKTLRFFKKLVYLWTNYPTYSRLIAVKYALDNFCSYDFSQQDGFSLTGHAGTDLLHMSRDFFIYKSWNAKTMGDQTICLVTSKPKDGHPALGSPPRRGWRRVVAPKGPWKRRPHGDTFG